MVSNLVFRKATTSELPIIISLLIEDELGQAREKHETNLDQAYNNAFQKIIGDPNQALMVVEQESEIIGTCHLTIMPSLTMIGTTRMNIEAVRVAENIEDKGLENG